MGERCVRFHLNYVKDMWFGVSKTSEMSVWLYGGPENEPKHTTRDNMDTATRAAVKSQSVRTSAACRTEHTTMHVPCASLFSAAPGTSRNSPWLMMAPRWRPEEDGKQSEPMRRQAAGVHTRMRAGGHTCARAVALAVREDPPSPAARPGPINGMGRAARCRAHALTGPASAKAQRRG